MASDLEASERRKITAVEKIILKIKKSWIKQW